MTDVLRGRDRNTDGRWPWEDGGREWNDQSASQEKLRITGHHQKLERGKEGVSLRAFRDHGPANTLILD